MKFSCNRVIALVVISSAFLLAATSCKKSNNNSSNGGINASVSGASWAANYPTIGLYVTSFGEFEIGGVQYKGGDSTAFAIYFSTPFTLGHAMNSDTIAVDVQYINAKTLQEYDGGDIAGWSTLTVKSYDSTGHKISGSFNGVLYNVTGGSDSLVIQNGSFTSSYTVQ
ncbi:MAG TPA: hypothetical protein VFE32_18895 [Puia sp.]|jgi:hypothetical protein|nr:hypothetical protein [Puia sp.]